MLYSFFLVILRRLNFIFRRFGTLCSIFIAGVSRNETVEVFIWENVWLENSLSQSDGGGEEGWVSEYRNRQWRARTTSGGQSKVRPSSLFMLCGCIFSSVASLMSRSVFYQKEVLHPVV